MALAHMNWRNLLTGNFLPRPDLKLTVENGGLVIYGDNLQIRSVPAHRFLLAVSGSKWDSLSTLISHVLAGGEPRVCFSVLRPRE